MDTICAWCSPSPASSAASRSTGRAAPSHGMCGRCLDERLAVLIPRRRRRAPMAVSRSRPLADRLADSWLASQRA